MTVCGMPKLLTAEYAEIAEKEFGVGSLSPCVRRDSLAVSGFRPSKGLPPQAMQENSSATWVNSLRSLRSKAFLLPEQVSDRLLHHRAAHFGNGPRQRNVLGAGLNT